MLARSRRSLSRLLCVVAFSLSTSLALAAGSLVPTRTDLTESAGGWKVFLTVKMGKKPANPHQAFRFIFKQTVLYETFLDDAHGDAEQNRTIPRPDSDPMVESLDVNFADVKGTVWETTKFDFTIRRDRGFDAGEYKVEVRDSDNHTVGTPFTLKLAGKNTVIDRRAMVMQGSGTKKKKEEKKDEPKDEKKDPPKDNAAASDAPKGDDDGGKTAGEAAPPPPVEKKAGGCGCTIPAAPESPAGLLLAGLGVAAIAARRRSR